MPKLRRLALLVGAAVLAVAPSLVAPALVAPSLVSPASAATYDPGTAWSNAPAFENEFNDYMQYSCSYAGWRAGVKVTWHCNLYDRHFCEECGGTLETTLIKVHTGTWTPPPRTKATPTFRDRYNPITSGNWCTIAWATSADGGTPHVMHCHP